MAEKSSFEINDLMLFRKKMLSWASRFSIFCFLDGNSYPEERAFPTMLAAGVKRSVSLSSGHAFSALRSFHESRPSYLFGHLGFSLMQETENVKGINEVFPDFGDGFFFEPEILIRLDAHSVTIESEEPAADIFKAICESPGSSDASIRARVTHSMSREEYLAAVKSIREHIGLGDCYELNYCQSFESRELNMDPVDTYFRLMAISPAPFSTLYRLHDRYCICASPERFLKKTGRQIISQPIKGTAPRFSDPIKDAGSLQALKESKKERSENVMIVDLVRNDLSKCCEPGSVEVDELFGIYSFPQVHQMISTVKGIINDEVHWTQLVSSCFPMGSMTGAPKKKVLELTARYEKTGRGLFSGSIGYISPEGDFDLNVVIRSIFYDHSLQALRFHTGGGITFYSDPEKEYEESILKASAIMRVLGSA